MGYVKLDIYMYVVAQFYGKRAMATECKMTRSLASPMM